MNINISKIDNTIIAKGYFEDKEVEIEIIGNETVNELFNNLENSKTVEQIRIEKLQKENEELKKKLELVTNEVGELWN